MHEGRGVEVDIISEWSVFEGESHTLQDHFLREVGGAKGSFAETIYEGAQRLFSFLSDAEEG